LQNNEAAFPEQDLIVLKPYSDSICRSYVVRVTQREPRKGRPALSLSSNPAHTSTAR